MKIIFDNEKQKETFMWKLQRFFCPSQIGLKDEKESCCKKCGECWNDLIEPFVLPDQYEENVLSITIQNIASLLNGNTLRLKTKNGAFIDIKFNKEAIK